MLNKFIVFIVIASFLAETSLCSTVIVENFNMTLCKDSPVDIQFENVNITRVKGKSVDITGSMLTSLDLVPPVKASIRLERKVLGYWMKVFCIHEMGSCTYDDMCQFGVPEKKNCPKPLVKNGIPCRCPIPRGNYTIPQSVKVKFEDSIFNPLLSVETGDYRGTFEVFQDTDKLTCYDVSFTLK